MGTGCGWTHLCSHVLIHVVGHLLGYMTDETQLALWTHVKDEGSAAPSWGLGTISPPLIMSVHSRHEGPPESIPPRRAPVGSHGIFL